MGSGKTTGIDLVYPCHSVEESFSATLLLFCVIMEAANDPQLAGVGTKHFQDNLGNQKPEVSFL